MSFTRPPSFQQCVVVSRLALLGGTATPEQIQELVPYSRNVLTALCERGFVQPGAGGWVLTNVGRQIARELLGEFAETRS